jgi:hypothetical protein
MPPGVAGDCSRRWTKLTTSQSKADARVSASTVNHPRVEYQNSSASNGDDPVGAQRNGSCANSVVIRACKKSDRHESTVCAGTRQISENAACAAREVLKVALTVGHNDLLTGAGCDRQASTALASPTIHLIHRSVSVVRTRNGSVVRRMPGGTDTG